MIVLMGLIPKVSELNIKSPPKLGKNDEYAQIINPVEIP